MSRGSFGCALLLALCLLSLTQPASAQYETPAFHLGETIPVVIYIRHQRQNRGMLNYITGRDDADEAEVPVWEARADNERVAEEALEDAMMAANARGAVGVLQIGTDADLIGTKHQRQSTRLVPPQQAPRFGVDRQIRLPATALYKRARAQMRADPSSEGSGLALRFNVGKGFSKETTWLPVATRAEQLRGGWLAELLAPALAQELQELAETGAAVDAKGRPIAANDTTTQKDGNPVYYLSQVTCYLGYQTGMLNRMTSLRYEYFYTLKIPDTLRIEYVWDEHRAFHPHRAITLCCIVAVVVAMGMTASIVGFRTGKAARHFKRRSVTVRRRRD